MKARNLVAVVAGWVFSLVAYVAGGLTAGLITCPDPHPEYTNDLIAKGYTVEALLCVNTHVGVRSVLALVVVCLLMIVAGLLVGIIARRDEMLHSVVSVALATQLLAWILLLSAPASQETARHFVLFSTPAIIFAIVGGYLAKRRHA